MKVFISYSRVDKEFAHRLADDLHRHGFQIWIDKEGIHGGDRWAKEIEAALDETDILLLILSPDSTKSKNVADEWNYFLAKGEPAVIIPLMYRKTKIPLGLIQLHHIDLSGESNDYAQDLDKILKELNTHRNGDKLPSESEFPKLTKTPDKPELSKPSSPRSQVATWGLVAVGFIVISGALVASTLFKAQPTPTPQPTVIAAQSTDTPSVTASASVSPSVTRTASTTNTDEPTVTATLTVTATTTATFSPTSSPSQTPTSTQTPSSTPIPPTATQLSTTVNVPQLAASSTAIPLVPTSTALIAASVTAIPRQASSTPLLPPPTTVPSTTQISTVLGGFPCDAKIIDDTATRMSIVRSEPYSNSSVVAFVRPNDDVRVVDKKPEGTKIIWYQIAYGDATPLGWVRFDYLVLSSACPK